MPVDCTLDCDAVLTITMVIRKMILANENVITSSFNREMTGRSHVFSLCLCSVFCIFFCL